MDIHTLDLLFPFFVLAYGFLVTCALSWPKAMALAEERLPPLLLKQLAAHRMLGLVCLVIGAFWSLQNLWLPERLF
jgi:hypothetical protein